MSIAVWNRVTECKEMDSKGNNINIKLRQHVKLLGEKRDDGFLATICRSNQAESKEWDNGTAEQNDWLR